MGGWDPGQRCLVEFGRPDGEKRSKVARAHRNLKPARDGECNFVADVAAKTSLLLPPQTGAARAGAESAGSSSLELQRLDCCHCQSDERLGGDVRRVR